MIVVLKVAGKCKLPIAVYETYSEAVAYCEYMDWEYVDDNAFYWQLAIAMDYADVWRMLPKD